MEQCWRIGLVSPAQMVEVDTGSQSAERKVSMVDKAYRLVVEGRDNYLQKTVVGGAV